MGQELPRCRVWDPLQDLSSSRRGGEELWDVAVGSLLWGPCWAGLDQGSPRGASSLGLILLQSSQRSAAG